MDEPLRTPADRPEVRPATAADLAGIAAIYDDAVLRTTATFDLEPQPVEVWATRLASEAPGDHVLVAVDGTGAVLGFAYSSAYRARPAYARTRETSAYLADGARGRGLGRRLYDDLLARLERDGVHRALALVALPNDASVALHRAAGFREVGTMTEVGRKFGRWIDTTWFERRLGDDPAG